MSTSVPNAEFRFSTDNTALNFFKSVNGLSRTFSNTDLNEISLKGTSTEELGLNPTLEFVFLQHLESVLRIDEIKLSVSFSVCFALVLSLESLGTSDYKKYWDNKGIYYALKTSIDMFYIKT